MLDWQRPKGWRISDARLNALPVIIFQQLKFAVSSQKKYVSP
jgi:hypothetical protein